MENFIYSIPTTIYFGKGQIEHVAQAVRPLREESSDRLWRGKREKERYF